jgi:hypothetical protein
MKRMVTLLFPLFLICNAVQAETIVEGDISSQPEPTTEEDYGIWMGQLLCYKFENEFFPLPVYCTNRIGNGRAQDIVDNNIMRSVQECCRINKAKEFVIDCTIRDRQGNEIHSDQATFPCK